MARSFGERLACNTYGARSQHNEWVLHCHRCPHTNGRGGAHDRWNTHRQDAKPLQNNILRRQCLSFIRPFH